MLLWLGLNTTTEAEETVAATVKGLAPMVIGLFMDFSLGNNEAPWIRNPQI